MNNYILFPLLLLATVSNAWSGQPKLNVVATQTIFADLVRQIGQDRVNVSAIASPKYNIHMIQPKPSDVRKVTKADLYVNAGLDLEAWSDPLLEAAGRPQLFRNGQDNVDVSQGLHLIQVPDHPLSRAEGDIHAFGNPHFHMNPENAKTMARTIAEALKKKDPANASYYDENLRSFLAKLTAKIEEWKSMSTSLTGAEIISYHEDIAYFADFLGLKAEQFLEPNPGIPPTPRHLQHLEVYAKSKQITVIVIPTYYPRAAAEALASKIGGKVITICQGVGEVAGTDDFFSFFDYNVRQMSQTRLPVSREAQ